MRPFRAMAAATTAAGAIGLVVAMTTPASATPEATARPAVSPQFLFCTWQVTGSNVRFRKTLHSTDAWGLLQKGDRVTGTASDTGTDGGLTFQHVSSGRFPGVTGWVAREFLSTVSCVNLE